MKTKRGEKKALYIWKIHFAIACFVFTSLFSNSLSAQETTSLARARQFEKQAGEAFQKKDFAAFLVNIRQAAELRPNHPRLLYNLAKACALNDNPAEAVKLLERLARMGMLTGFENDKDFQNRIAAGDVQKIKNLFAVNRQPLNKSLRAFTLPEKDLVAESVAYDSISKSFFVSSIHQRKIVSIDRDGKTKDFSSPADNLWSALGMKIDEKRRLLWVCTTALPQMKNFQKSDEGASGIFKYDLKSGKLLKKYLLPTGAEKHGLGDLVIAENGDVFATDSVSPAIYRVDTKSDEIKVFLNGNSFASLQGLTFTPDEKRLFVADYSLGIFSVEMATKKITRLTPAAEVAALGIDGLYFHKGKLVAVQNGTNPQRIARFSLSKDNLQIIASEALEANHADFAEPTLGVLAGDDFYFVAASGWETIDEKGELAEAAKLREPVVLRLKL